MKAQSNLGTTHSFLRLPQIIGNPRADPPIPPLIPIGRSTWWQWVKKRKAPAPIKLAPRTTAWRACDIHAFIESLNAGEANENGGE